MKLLCLLCSFIMSSCITLGPAYDIDGLEVDPGFNGDKISERMIQIGWATRAPELGRSISLGDSQKLSRILVKKLLKKDSKLPIKAKLSAEEIGWGEASLHLKNYSESGELDPAAMNKLKEKISSNAYQVFARVIEEKIERSRNGTKLKDTDNWKYSVPDEEVTLSTIKTMSVEYKVYDLSLRKLVWSGEITKVFSDSNTFTDRNGMFDALIGGAVDAAFMIDKSFPKAPSTGFMLNRSLRDFVKALRSLPRTEKNNEKKPQRNSNES